MLNSEEIIAAIHGSYATGSKNGFQNVLTLLDKMHVALRTPIVHVAGTNGKGSTCAMLESVLRRAGYHTGLYTSPFLQAYQERIRLDGLPLDDARMVKYGNPLVQAAEEMRAEGAFVTPFEMGTALALAAFDGENCDIAIVEVGMGGRKDPTNIVHPILCAITAIGLDHMAYLGNTLEAIAGEKAGIIKDNTPVVCHPAKEGVRRVFAEAAEKLHAPLRQLSDDTILYAACDAHGATVSYRLSQEWQDVRLNLPGAHQIENAMSVLAMVEELRRQGWTIPAQAVYEGLASTVWPARLEWCGRILIDGAHNPQGVRALRNFVEEQLPNQRRVLLTGVLADKLQEDMLRDFCAIADDIVTVTPDNPRALDAQTYADALCQRGAHAQAAKSLEEGLTEATRLAGDDAVIVAAGSLYFAGSLRTALGLSWRTEA